MSAIPVTAALSALAALAATIVTARLRVRARRLQARDRSRCHAVGNLPPGSSIVEMGRRGMIIDVPAPGPCPADLPGEARCVLTMLRSLPADQRVAVAFQIDGFSCRETADRLGIAEQKARDLRKKARRPPSQPDGQDSRKEADTVTSDHERPPGGLPAALVRAQDDLAACICARVSPSAALLKIMEASDSPVSADIPPAPARRDGSQYALAVIRIRALARDLDHALASDFARASTIARDLASDLARVSGLASDRDIARGLACASGLASGLARNLFASSPLGLASVRADYLQMLGEIEAAPVDVSGADLSGEDLGDLDVLQDVIWTPETTRWPPGVTDLLLQRSREIRPGVCHVLGNGGRDPMILVIM